MKHLSIIGLIFFLTPSVFGCVSFRNVQLINSPFGFDNFTVTGSHFNFRSANGQQTISFFCRNEDGINKWYINASDDPDTEKDETLRDFHIPFLNSNGQLMTFTETAPQTAAQAMNPTVMSPFRSAADAATLDIRAGEGNYLSLRCSVNETGLSRMDVQARDAQGNVVAEVRSEHQSGYRSVGGLGGPQDSLDMANLTPQSINVASCGGSSAPSRNTNGNGSEARP